MAIGFVKPVLKPNYIGTKLARQGWKMRILLNKWLGHEEELENDGLICDVCFKTATVAELPSIIKIHVCLSCLNVATKAIQAAVLAEASKG
jgi:hypothetical protein